MPDNIAGFPFWTLSFDSNGASTSPEVESALAAGIAAQHLTDLFIFSHGWNNSPAEANTLYKGFFGEVRKLVDDSTLPQRRQAVIGAAGVIWPSVLWPDEVPATAAAAAGGAASLGSAVAANPFTELRKAFPNAEQQSTLNDLERMLNDRSRNNVALQSFMDKLRQFAASDSPSGGASKGDPTDEIELRGIRDTGGDWRDVLGTLADGEDSGDQGGSAGLGDAFGKLWSGAKGALRVTSYWMMKDRAAKVGRQGLGPMIGRLSAKAPDLRVHLIGHSFGARLVSFTLTGLPDAAVGPKSPVKSLFLLQGAFSHFAFADSLPFDSRRSGELKGMANRVDGPLLATHSLKDLAVGRAYPLASLLARQDASAAEPDRWGAVGNDGAQGVQAGTALLGRAGTAYNFSPGHWTNLDGNRVIVNGGPPSGAHSDIIYPHTAWAALVAAGLRG